MAWWKSGCGVASSDPDFRSIAVSRDNANFRSRARNQPPLRRVRSTLCQRRTGRPCPRTKFVNELCDPATGVGFSFFPERFFLACEVGHGHGDYWDAIEGRTPFVRRAQLDAWLAHLHSRIGSRRNRDIPPMFALRQCLIGLVMDGLLPSTEGEALAEKWGQVSLATSPPPSKFDPMLEPGWSLAMTIAWISKRRADAVRDSWTAFRTECWEWFPTKRKLPLDGGATWWASAASSRQPLKRRGCRISTRTASAAPWPCSGSGFAARLRTSRSGAKTWAMSRC